MLSSRKDKESKNLNRVVIQVGDKQTNKDLLDFKFYENGVEYSLSELLDKLFHLEDRNRKLEKALKQYESSNNDNINLITKAAQLLSAKVVQLEDEVATLKNKCKYL